METYRSGHNEPHSKCGCPFWARGFESHRLRFYFLLESTEHAVNTGVSNFSYFRKFLIFYTSCCILESYATRNATRKSLKMIQYSSPGIVPGGFFRTTGTYQTVLQIPRHIHPAAHLSHCQTAMHNKRRPLGQPCIVLSGSHSFLQYLPVSHNRPPQRQ